MTVTDIYYTLTLVKIQSAHKLYFKRKLLKAILHNLQVSGNVL